jgi:hydroxymethylglutaryl-CoA lyase
MNEKVRISESPRDAMQGLSSFIPTAEKLSYLQALLEVGFHTLDAGSFVSPKAIPQMRDTGEVIDGLDRSGSESRILVVVGNLRGAEAAINHANVDTVGFPFSISETFLRNNINSDIQRSCNLISQLAPLCRNTGRELVIYLSMAFGNPYGDDWSIDLLIDWIGRLRQSGVKEFALSDTIGISTAKSIDQVYASLIPAFPELNFSLHLHTLPGDGIEKLDAAYSRGCRAFDGVMNGLGGCPMTGHSLVSNVSTGLLISFLESRGIDCGINKEAYNRAFELGEKLFNFPHSYID